MGEWDLPGSSHRDGHYVQESKSKSEWKVYMNCKAGNTVVALLHILLHTHVIGVIVLCWFEG